MPDEAVEHFSPLRGSSGAIEASPFFLHRHHGDRLEDLPEDAISARRILFQELGKLFQARLDLGWADPKRADGWAVGQRPQSCLKGVAPPFSILQQRRSPSRTRPRRRLR